MIQFGCPHCWTLLEAKNKKRSLACPICNTVIRPDEMDEDLWFLRNRGLSPYRRKWRARLWSLFGGGTFFAIIFVVLCTRVAGFYLLTLIYGIALAIAAIVILFIVANIEQKLRPHANPLPAGLPLVGVQSGVIGVMGAMVAWLLLIHSYRWPQPLFTGLMAAGTITGALTLEAPNREEPKATRPNAPPAAPPAAPPTPPPAQPQRPVEPSFVRAKTPPTPAEFDGLTAYWSFDEGDGEEALEAFSQKSATLSRCRWVKGIRGAAVWLDGKASVVYLNNAPGLNFGKNAPFTVSLWVQPGDKRGIVFGFRSSPDGLAFLRIWLDNGKPHAWIRHDRGIFIPHGVSSRTPLRVGEWHHLALVRQPEGGIDLYQDGELIDRQGPGREATGPITTNSRGLGIDPLDLKNPNPNFFAGAIDEFCAFNRALSPSEIKSLAGRD